MNKEKTKLYIQIPTKIIRNEDYKLKNGDFILYTYLCYYYFRNDAEIKKNIKLDHKDLMLNCRITDTRTLKKRLTSLYKNGLIEENIIKLSNRGKSIIKFNEELYKKEKEYHYTQMNAEILRYFNTKQIDEYAVRQVFYYKSQINPNENKMFSYVGFDTLANSLGISKDKVDDANKQLKKVKLIKVVKHKLGPTYEYDTKDALVYDRYNNHYSVANSMF